MTGNKKRAPLEGIRVIDFSAMIAGPHCTRLLADCGAEVIKIEPKAGELMRHLPPVAGGESTYFGSLNCGKKSVTLDLRDAGDLDRAQKLINSADVLVENFRPGVMQRLGLDYSAVSQGNPDLVYCSISGYGQTGPRAMEPAYAPIIHAASGYDSAQMGYQDELTRPEKCGIFTADILAGVYAFSAVQTALIGRFRHGGGQYVDVALLDAMVHLLVYECQTAQHPLDGKRVLYAPSRTADGFVVIAPISEQNFIDMANTMNPDWKTDPRFAKLPDRRANWDDLNGEIERWTVQRSSVECERILAAAGVPCSRTRNVEEVFNDPQTLHRGLMEAVGSGAARYLVPNPPFVFADGSVGTTPRVPRLGEHNGEFQ